MAERVDICLTHEVGGCAQCGDVVKYPTSAGPDYAPWVRASLICGAACMEKWHTEARLAGCEVDFVHVHNVVSTYFSGAAMIYAIDVPAWNSRPYYQHIFHVNL